MKPCFWQYVLFSTQCKTHWAFPNVALKFITDFITAKAVESRRKVLVFSFTRILTICASMFAIENLSYRVPHQTSRWASTRLLISDRWTSCSAWLLCLLSSNTTATAELRTWGISDWASINASERFTVAAVETKHVYLTRCDLCARKKYAKKTECGHPVYHA